MKIKLPITVKRVQQIAARQPAWTAILGLWFVSQMVALIVKALPDLNWILIKPYAKLVAWDPATEFGKYVLFNLLFWPIVGFGWLIFKWIRALWLKTTGQSETVKTPMLLYKEELAAAIEALDTGTQDEQAETVEELLFTIGDTIAVNLGIRKKEYRMYFFTADENKPIISGFRLGKQFDLERKGKLDVEHIIDSDLDFLKRLIRERSTEVIVPTLNIGDVRSMLLTRNPGNLRFGVFVVILKEGVPKEVMEEIYPIVSNIVSTLGFIDKLTELVVQYGQEGGETDGDG